MKQTTSPAGVARIAGFEGCRLTAYRDCSPQGIWTIGVGHTGASVTQGLKITQARAEQLLAADLDFTEAAINRYVKVPLTQDQFDALVSLTFNIGTAALSTSTLLKELNAGQYAQAADEFPKWIHSGGVVEPGLVTRRAADRALFLTGIAA